MAKLDTLTDAFTDNNLSPNWQAVQDGSVTGAAVESGGMISVEVSGGPGLVARGAPGAGYLVTTTATYDLTDSYGYCQVKQIAGSASDVYRDTRFYIGPDEDNFVGWNILARDGSSPLNALMRVGGGAIVNIGTNTVYTPGVHDWFRIRHDSTAGQIVWEYAADDGGRPAAWVEFTRTATPFTITAVVPLFGVGRVTNIGAQFGTDQSALFDNFNLVSTAQPLWVTQAGLLVFRSGSAELQVTQAGLLVFHSGGDGVRVTQAGLLVFHSGASGVRVTQAGLLVFREDTLPTGPRTIAPIPGIELWDDVAANGGERLAMLRDITDGEITLSFDSEGVVVTVPASHHQRGNAASVSGRVVTPLPVFDGDINMVLRVTDHFGGVTEWDIDAISDGWPDTDLVIHAVPVWLRLGNTIVHHYRGTGVRTRVTAFDIEDALVSEIIRDYALANADAQGLAWFLPGTASPDELTTLSVADVSRLELLRELEDPSKDRYFHTTRPDDSHYLVHLGPLPAAPEILLHPSKNVEALSRARERGNSVSAVIPHGGVPTGAIQPAGVEHNLWKVASKSGSDVVLEDPATGRGPVVFDGQFTTLLGASHVLRIADGSQVTIVDTVAPGTFTVSDASGIAVGDLVSILEEATIYLSGVYHPTLVQDPPVGMGLVTAVVTDQSLRGEANFLPNPGFDDWASEPVALAGVVTGGSGSTLNVRVIPGSVIAAGARVYGGANKLYGYVVTTGGTADSNGDVSLSGTGNTGFQNMVRSPGDPVIILGSEGPDLWTQAASTLVVGSPVVFRDATYDSDIDAVLDGDHNTANRVTLRGLPAGHRIQHGDTVYVAGSLVGPRRVLSNAVADANGTVTIDLFPGEWITGTDGSVVEVRTNAAFPKTGEGTQYALGMPAAGKWSSPAGYVPFDSANATLTVIARATIEGYFVGALNLLPRIDVYSETLIARGGVPPIGGLPIGLLGSTTINDQTQPAAPVAFNGAPLDVTLVLQVPITEAHEIRVDLYAGGATTAPNLWPWGLTTWWRSVMVTLSPDPAVPFANGSHANELLFFGQRRLVELAVRGTRYSLDVHDLAVSGGALLERLYRNQDARIVVPGLDLDDTVKIVSYTFNDRDRSKARIECVREPDRFSRMLVAPLARLP